MLGFTARDLPRLRHSGDIGMTVLSACWGLGVGAHLLECLLEWARAGGVVRKLNLRVRTDNMRAIRLYQRMGFAVEGTIEGDFSLGGVDYDHHWMGLKL
jgi:RimJ/RimL family protein N-acetyltransferase